MIGVNDMVEILSLCDNVIDDKECWTTEGLSLLIKYNGLSLLFDTGRSSDVLLHNLNIKNIDLQTIDYVVLSHGHKGHIGAIADLVNLINPTTTVIFGKGIERQKLKIKNGKNTLDSSVKNADYIDLIKNNCKYIELTSSHEIISGLTLLFDIPIFSKHLTAFSDNYRVVVSDKDETDLFSEEIAICIEIDNKLLIISGCSHRGIDNIISYACKIKPDKCIFGVVGGFHTQDNNDKTKLLIEYFVSINPELIAPCHCTGIFSKSYIRQYLPNSFNNFTTGKFLNI